MDVMQLFEFQFLAAVSAMVIFLPVLFVTRFGRRWLAPWARHTLWSLVLLRLLIPCSVSSSFSLQPFATGVFEYVYSFVEWVGSEPSPVSQLTNVEIATTTAMQETTEAVVTNAVPSIMAEVATFSWVTFIVSTFCGLTLFSTMCAVVWSTVTSIRIRRWVHSGTDTDRPEWLAMLAEGQRLFGIDWSVRLRTDPRLTSPATYGWWRPMILLPDDAFTLSMTELRHVLWHELAHISRHDVARNWVLAVIRAIHFWNPMFWWAQREWLADRELACDAMVLRRLDGSTSSDYGKTLLRFLERMSTDNGRMPSSAAPGLVLFLGRKTALRRRLEQLGKLGKPEGTSRRWIGRAVIVILGLAGLTDAAARPQHVSLTTSMDLPSGTTWKMIESDNTDSDEPRTTMVYDVSATIARLHQDEPESTDQANVNFLLTHLGYIVRSQQLEKSQQADVVSPLSHVEVQGHSFIVNATSAQHEAVQQLLNRWRDFGVRQVVIEITMADTEGTLKDLIPGSGGQVLNAGATGDIGAIEAAPFDSKAQSWTLHSVPAFLQVLTPDEDQTLRDRLQQVPRSNLLFAPKVTMFDGSFATMGDTRQRPFVTGLKTMEGGRYEPLVTKVSEGMQIHVRSEFTEDGSSKVCIRYLQTDIVDVETLQIITTGAPAHVQIPHVTQSVVNAVKAIPPGHSLLIAPLRRDNGKLKICLIKPNELHFD